MQLFYKADFGETQMLDETDSKHCIKVLRKAIGDEVWVTNGLGDMYQCTITDANPKKALLKTTQHLVEFQKSSRRIHLAIAPTKNIDRITYLVEKATEIGLSEISFILTTNSERRIIKTDRVERVAISAMKQSLKAYLPKVNELVTYEEFIANNTSNQKFIAHLSEKSSPLESYSPENDVCIVVGPEGDFTDEELSLAEQAGYKQVSMGTSRLRTETAGLVGVTLLNLLK